MKAIKTITSLFFGLLLCACSTKFTALNADAQNVAVVLNLPENCQRIGEVDGYKKNDYGDLSLQGIRNSAKNDLKNKAYAMGADTLVIISTEGLNANSGYYAARRMYGLYNEGFYVPYSYTKEYHIEAIAYKCERKENVN